MEMKKLYALLVILIVIYVGINGDFWGGLGGLIRGGMILNFYFVEKMFQTPVSGKNWQEKNTKTTPPIFQFLPAAHTEKYFYFFRLNYCNLFSLAVYYYCQISLFTIHQ